MIPRNITESLLAALKDSPVVLLNGARQTGKSTLVQALASSGHPARYLTFDDATVLASARQDPQGFIAGLNGPMILDEVQRVPEIFLSIKAEVDRSRCPGQFLLTGSADVLLLPRLAESLAGRMEVLTLWPFSQGELEKVTEGSIDAFFAKELPPFKDKPLNRSELFQRVLAGGYPEAVTRKSEDRRRAWFGSYLTTILQRDVRDLAQIEGLTILPRLLSLLATRTMSLLNYSDLSRSVGIPQTTLKRYMALLETTFLLQSLPAWYANIGKRLVKSPKLMLLDTGLAAHLLGMSVDRLSTDAGLAGPLLENFVAMEIRKQALWSRTHVEVYHVRSQAGQEVDLIMEDAAGSIVGVEVKASGTVTGQDFTGLRVLADAVKERFRRGIVLYTGSEPVAFAEKFYALPMSALWQLKLQ